MLNGSMLTRGLRGAGIAAAAMLFTVPALAGEIYSWRTEDGAYAFTDDLKAVPVRYRDQVETRADNRIANYARLTAPEAGSSEAYAKRLAARLDHLRALNRDLDATHAPAPVAATQTLSLDTGVLNVALPGDTASGPVVIENIRYRHDGELATRHNVVVRKGGETVAIIQGKRNIGEINQAPGLTHWVD